MLIMLALTLGTVGGIAVLITPRAVAATPVGWLTTSGAQIQTSAGKPYRIAGLSWFGMESGRCSPEGLDTISLDAGMTKIASFGFNTLRLPFSNQCLAATTAGSVNGIDYGKNPGLANKTPLQVMDAVIASAGSHGLSVILDDHRLDSGYQSETWYSDAYPETRWISDWQSLATRYADNTAVIGVDLFNEPNGRSCWGCGGANDWAAAATRAGNAILARNSHLLILVEGVERQGNGQNTWWGGGLADAAQRPISLSVAHRLVYAPHDYPATVWPQSWFSASNYPANLPAVWDGNWGYLAKQNQAPIVVGEFGTRYQSQSDQQWLNTLVSYIRANNLGFMYWSFNPTSSDTGGLVGDDWVTPQQAKLNALAPILAGPAGSTTGPGAPATSATPKPTSTPTPTSTHDNRPAPETDADADRVADQQRDADRAVLREVVLGLGLRRRGDDDRHRRRPARLDHELGRPTRHPGGLDLGHELCPVQRSVHLHQR